MWKLALICVLAAPAVVAADAPAHRRAPAACEAKGPPLVEVDRIKAGTPEQKQVTTIFENGAWSTGDATPEVGCVPDGDFKQLRDALANAPWKVTKQRMHCMAVSPIHTEYRYKGKLVWTARLCSGEELDKDSAAAIGELDQLVDKLDPKREKLN
jgi:hypothetical protein